MVPPVGELTEDAERAMHTVTAELKREAADEFLEGVTFPGNKDQFPIKDSIEEVKNEELKVTLTEWVKEVDPNESREALEFIESKIPKKYRELVLKSFRDEPLQVLELVRLTRNNPIVKAVVLQKNLHTHEDSSGVAEVNETLKKKLRKSRFKPDEIAETIEIVNEIGKLGPLKIEAFVEELGDDLGEGLAKLQKRRAVLYEQLIEKVDKTSRLPTTRPTWAPKAGEANESPKEATEKGRVTEKLKNKEIDPNGHSILTYKTKQTLNGKQVKTSAIWLGLRYDEKLDESVTDPRIFNPEIRRTIEVKAETLEEVTELLERLHAAIPLDENRDPYKKPIKKLAPGIYEDSKGTRVKMPCEYAFNYGDHSGEYNNFPIEGRKYFEMVQAATRLKIEKEREGFVYDESKKPYTRTREHIASGTDQIRQRILLKKALHQNKGKLETLNRPDIQNWDDNDQKSFEEAMGIYTIFTERHNSKAVYIQLARQRLKERGVEETTETWHQQMAVEIQNITVEMAYMNAELTDRATRVFYSKEDPYLLLENLKGLKESVLANVAFKLVADTHIGLSREEAHQRLKDLMRDFEILTVEKSTLPPSTFDKLDELRASMHTVAEELAIDPDEMLMSREAMIATLEPLFAELSEAEQLAQINQYLTQMGLEVAKSFDKDRDKLIIKAIRDTEDPFISTSERKNRISEKLRSEGYIGLTRSERNFYLRGGGGGEKVPVEWPIRTAASTFVDITKIPKSYGVEPEELPKKQKKPEPKTAEQNVTKTKTGYVWNQEQIQQRRAELDKKRKEFSKLTKEERKSRLSEINAALSAMDSWVLNPAEMEIFIESGKFWEEPEKNVNEPIAKAPPTVINEPLIIEEPPTRTEALEYIREIARRSANLDEPRRAAIIDETNAHFQERGIPWILDAERLNEILEREDFWKKSEPEEESETAVSLADIEALKTKLEEGNEQLEQDEDEDAKLYEKFKVQVEEEAENQVKPEENQIEYDDNENNELEQIQRRKRPLQD